MVTKSYTFVCGLLCCMWFGANLVPVYGRILLCVIITEVLAG